LEGETLALWRVLSDEPRHAEVLAAACGLDPARALVQLLALELGGHARQLAGLRFVRLAAALALD
jgi:predicted Rossmann fold nucleotide-binding protein DprA/Smf involved in DNA uptake